MKVDPFYATFGAYLIVGLLTFGYAANAEREEPGPETTQTQVTAGAIMNGVVFGMVWPMYLTYKAFSWARP